MFEKDTGISGPILEGRDLNKEYRSGERTVRPLQHVDFELYPREILGIVGESGSGKSTLLRIISGVERADSGELYRCGREYSHDGPAKNGRSLQMIFQDAHGSFDPRMSLEKSLMEGADADRTEMLRLIKAVGLSEDLLKRRPGSLSGGQCQRMSIARALLSHASIILCDEITSALDVTAQAQVIDLIMQLRDSEGVSVIMVTHDLALVSMTADRIMVMRDGAVVEHGDTAAVLNHPRHEYTKMLIDSVITV